jgi:hypothetical protein
MGYKMLVALILSFCLAQGSQSAEESEEQAWKNLLQDLNTKDATFEADKVLVKDRYRGMLIQIESGIADAQTIEEELRLWQDEVVPLLTNEDGKYVAADPEAAEKIRGFFNLRESIPDSIATGQTALLEGLHGDLSKTIEQVDLGSIPSEESEAELRKTIDSRIAEARTTRDRIRALRQATQRLVTEAKAGNQKSPYSLQDVLAQIDLEAMAQIARENEEQMAKVQRDMAKKKSDQEIRHYVQKVLDELEKNELIHTIHRGKVANQALIDRAKSIEIQNKFAPFLMKGRMVPDMTYGWTIEEQMTWKAADRDVPLSYSYLEKIGALNDDDAGLRRFAAIGKAGGRSGRTPWNISYSLNDLSAVAEAQALFKELAPVFIEQKMLLP